MSFAGGAGGAGGAGETLAYMIRAYDMATPVFKAFGAQVSAVTKQVETSLAEMNRALANYDRELAGSAGKQKAALGEVSKAQSTAAKSATGAAQTQVDASKRATAAVNEQAAAAQRAADRQKAAALETEAAATRSSGALQRTGRNVLLTSATTIAGTVDMAAHFQANTLRMTTQAGATTKGLDQIRQGLLKMAGQVGATPNQLANGMYHVVSALNAVLPPATRVSQELAIMKIAAEGAQVGHSNLEETTYALSSALNALHMTAKDAGTVMGQLNAIVGAGDMTMQDLIDSFKSGLIPAANSFGISLQSVGAALSVMGDMGMRGALAGTRLRMAISLLAAPTKQAAGILEALGMKSTEAISTSEKMSETLKKAGVNVTQLSYDLKQPDGLAVALSDLNHHLQAAGLNSTAAGAAISRAFGGGRMGAAITLLAENTDRLKLKFDQIGVTGQNFGNAWKQTSETFRVQVDRAVAAVEALGIRIGEVLIPYATKGLHALEDMANWLVQNKIVLEALGGAFITFSSVAIGTYFVAKIKGAMGLMRDFGHSVAGVGRWMFGGGGGGGTSGVSPSGGPLGTGGGGLTGLFGYMGSPLRVGTMMNPIAVVFGRGAAGAAGGAGTGTPTPPVMSAESKASAARSQATMDQIVAGQATVDRDIAASVGGTKATLDQMLAQQEKTNAILPEYMAGGKFRDPASGRFISQSQAQTLSTIAGTPAGVASLQEMKAEEEAAVRQAATRSTQLFWREFNAEQMAQIKQEGFRPNQGQYWAADRTYAWNSPSTALRGAESGGINNVWNNRVQGNPAVARITPPPGAPFVSDPEYMRPYALPGEHGFNQAFYTTGKIPPENIQMITPAQLGADAKAANERLEEIDLAIRKAEDQLQRGAITAKQFDTITTELAADQQEIAVSLEEAAVKWEGFGGVLAREQRFLAGMTAEAQLAVSRLPQIQQELSLFDGNLARTAEGLAVANEQLGLGGIATTEKALSQVPSRKLPGIIGTDPFAGLTQQEQFAKLHPDGRFGAPVSQLGPAEGVATGGVRSIASEAAGTLKSTLSKAMDGLMRGGLFAGMGLLLSQTIGDAVGGGVGNAMKKIGTGAAIGGGLGSVFGPWGTALGTALGAGVGAMVSSGLFDSQGVKAAKDFSKGFGGVTRTELQHDVAHWIDDANKQLSPPAKPASNQPGGSKFGIQHPENAAHPGPTPAQIAQAEQDWFETGRSIAKHLQDGWNQYKFQDEPTMVKQLRTELGKNVPIQAKAWATESMISYARSLEQAGRLPRGATAQMITQMRAEFPGFEKYLGLTADASAATFAKNFKLKTAQDNTKAALTAMEGDFSGVREAIINTSGTMTDKANVAVKALMSIVHGPNSSAAMRAQAQHDLDTLRAATSDDFTAMADVMGSKVGDMKTKVGNDVGALTSFAGGAMSNFGANVFAAMSSGALSTSQAMDAMVADTNKVLAQLGGDHLTAPQVKGLAQLNLNIQQYAAAHGGIGGGAETGGWIGSPGERGRDSVGIVVGRGEAVLKHQDQRIVNAALSRTKYGSLGGVFAANRGLTHSGAPLAMEVGGYVYPNGPGNVPERIDQGKDFGGAFDVGAIGPGTVLRNTIWHNWPGTGGAVYHLNAGARSGQNVYIMEGFQAGVQVGQTLTAGQVVGRATAGPTGIEEGWANAAGTGPLTPYNGAPDGTPMPGGADYAAFINGLVHGVLTGSSVGALGGINIPTWTNIKAPKVLGTGKLAALEQANVNKTAARINAWGQNKVSMMGGFSGAAFAGQGGGNAANQALGHRMMLAAGFPESDWPALLALWNQESGWNANSVNSSSGAYGIPQSLGHGHPYNLGDAPAQIAWGLNYIRQRYSPGDAIQNAWAHERSNNWYDRGGFAGNPIQYAGAFGQGGAFTTTGPTLALFGEGGRPETVMAFQGGGLIPADSQSTSVHQGAKGTSTTSSNSSSVIQGGQKVTTHHSVTEGPGGTTQTTTVTTTPIKPPKPPKPKTDHFHWGYDPLTGQIEYHDTAQWQMIHAQEAQQHAKAAAAKKAYDAWLAQKVTDTLTIGRLPAGDIQQTRKALMGEHLPLGGPLSLLGNLNKLPDSGFKQIQSSLSSYLNTATVDQSMRLADRFAHGMVRTGPDAPLFHEIGKLTGQMNHLNQQADMRQHQADRLHHLALSEHGKQRQHAMQQARADHKDAQKLRQQASADMHKIATAGDKIAGSRTAQLGNTIISAALKGVTGAFTAQQTTFQHSDTIAQLIENAPAGSTARSLHLSPAQLKAAGLTPDKVKALAGTASGPGALTQQIQDLTTQVIPQYQTDARNLSRLYQDALKTHNKKLQGSLLSQLDTVTQAQLKAYGDLATAQVNLVESHFQQGQAKASAQQSSSDILGAIENLAPGTDLSGMGLTPQVLQGLGIDSNQAGALQGSSLTYLQNLQSQQGGTLTAAQIAQAKSGTDAQNQILAAQRATDVSTLSDLQAQLPSLKGSAADAAQTHITDLAKSILGLTDEMNKNTDAVDKLTQATNQNTTATGSMTGQVAYTYQGQGYIAGVGLSSDQTINLGQGL